jgi:hypothetical protein
LTALELRYNNTGTGKVQESLEVASSWLIKKLLISYYRIETLLRIQMTEAKEVILPSTTVAIRCWKLGKQKLFTLKVELLVKGLVIIQKNI